MNSLGVTSNKAKVGALLAYLCYRMPNVQLRKLLKVLYLIDEASVRSRAIPMTWLDYYVWEKGPVAPEVYQIKNKAFSDYVTCHLENDDKWHVSSVKQEPYLIEKDMRLVSQWEQELIDKVIEKCKDKSADTLTDESHTADSLWSKIVEEHNIDFSKGSQTDYLIDLNLLNGDNEVAKVKYQDAKECMQMQALLNGFN